MKLPVYLIDTFTAIPSKGNPTAVCYTDEPIPGIKMQSIARELNLPVTAFIRKTKLGFPEYAIRYFTPSMEIPVCGHATLAAAKLALAKDQAIDAGFRTTNNTLIETKPVESLIMMSYPAYETETCMVSESILKSLGLPGYDTGMFCPQLETLFIETNSAELKRVQPDFIQLVTSSDQIKEVVITCAADSGKYDYLLRSFCPWIGIDEDPVTGSVHSVLAGFWGNRFNKKNLVAYQASERGGELFLNVHDKKVDIGGESVIVSTQQIMI